jgi:hypothetical protein
MKEQTESRSNFCCVNYYCWLQRRGRSLLISAALTGLLLSLACKDVRQAGQDDSTKNTAQVSQQSAAESVIDDEEYEVYSTILNKEIRRSNIDKIVIANHTLREAFDREYILRHGKASELFVQSLSGEMIEDFDRKNKNEHPLSERFPPVRKFSLYLVDKGSFFTEGTTLQAYGQWKKFYERFPNAQGLFSFSRVGFNRDRNKAFVSIATSEGVGGGYGALVSLAKRREGWVVERRLQLWVV